MKINDLFLLVGGAAVLGIVHNVLFYDQSLGINFFLFAALILVLGWGLSKTFGKNVQRSAYVVALPLLFFAGMVFVRSSALLTFFNVIAVILLLGVIVRSQTEKSLREFLPLDYLKILLLPFKFIKPFFRVLFTFFAEISGMRKMVKEHPRMYEIVRGTSMALIALVVFVFLFSRADSSFNALVDWVFSFHVNLNAEVVARFVLFGFTTAFFMGVFGYMFKQDHEHKVIVKEEKRPFGALEIKILLGSINALFFGFIILQTAHFFGGVSNILSEGITYAEYARKGFFELVLVAILSYAIITTVEKNIIKNGVSHFRSFKFLSVILVTQVVVILVSAFTRLSLYEDAYGFTTIRLYSHAFMVWLAVILFLLARHILTGEQRSRFTTQVFVCIILLLTSMNLINPDAFIAKKNLVRYHQTGNIDTDYLANLSTDAVPYTVELLSDPSSEIALKFGKELSWARYRSGERFIDERGWPSFQISRAKAKEVLAPYTEFLEINREPTNI